MTVTLEGGFTIEQRGAGSHVYVGDGRTEGSDRFLEGAGVSPETNRLLAEMRETLNSYRGLIEASMGWGEGRRCRLY